MKDLRIRALNIAVTNRCNFRCQMCDIWKEKEHLDLNSESLIKIAESRIIDSNTNVSITGGEPFLYRNLSYLIRLFATNGLSISTITTNGSLIKPIENFLINESDNISKNFQLLISHDGWFSEIRGNDPCQVWRNIALIKRKYSGLNLGVKFTIQKSNIDQILDMQKKGDELGIKIKFKLVEYAMNYTNRSKSKDSGHLELFTFSDHEKSKIIFYLLKLIKECRNVDSKMLTDIILFLKGRSLKMCKTPATRLFVMPNGDLYSCVHMPKIGNVTEEKISKVLTNDQRKMNIIEGIKGNCCNCVSYHGRDLVRCNSK